MRLIAMWAGRLALVALLVAPPAYAWNPALVLVALFQARSWLAASRDADPAVCAGEWSVPVDAETPYLAPFFPETKASYRVLTVATRDTGRPLAFRIDGVAPTARYWSLHAYDAASGAIVSALSDNELGPDAGEAYRVELRADAEAGQALSFPAGLDSVALVFRVYDGQGTPPTATAFDATTGAPAQCRARFALPDNLRDPAQAAARDAVFADMLAGQRALIAEGDATPIRFRARRAETTALFANRHVIYAYAPLDPALGETVEIALRPPPLSPESGPGVRYWSVCLSGARETSTSACLNDTTIAVDADGLARFVIGPGNGAPTPQAGVNRFGWGWFFGPRLLIVRQLDTKTPFGGGFAGSFAAVPEGETTADGVIGDFAPTGRYRR